MWISRERYYNELHENTLRLCNDIKIWRTKCHAALGDVVAARSEAGRLGRIIHRQREVIKRLKERTAVSGQGSCYNCGCGGDDAYFHTKNVEARRELSQLSSNGYPGEGSTKAPEGGGDSELATGAGNGTSGKEEGRGAEGGRSDRLYNIGDRLV